MSKARTDWTVWLSYRALTGRQTQKRYRRDGWVVCNGDVWAPILTIHRQGSYNLRRDAKDAITGIHPWIANPHNPQWDRIKILPVGTAPR